ncbi:MAG: hypothetical protein Q4Q07_08630 [Tissierellia bacterium]|nr:hypothetical protein [Tissierellia bacterium]
MNRVEVDRRVLIAFILLICSFTIIIYQLRYSESARIEENLKDFGNMETFLSSKVSQIDIEKIARRDNGYSFTIINKGKVEEFQELGKVFMVDKNGELINYFTLFRNNEKYLIYMRGIYMSMD